MPTERETGCCEGASPLDSLQMDPEVDCVQRGAGSEVGRGSSGEAGQGRRTSGPVVQGPTSPADPVGSRELMRLMDGNELRLAFLLHPVMGCRLL